MNHRSKLTMPALRVFCTPSVLRFSDTGDHGYRQRRDNKEAVDGGYCLHLDGGSGSRVLGAKPRIISLSETFIRRSL